MDQPRRFSRQLVSIFAVLLVALGVCACASAPSAEAPDATGVAAQGEAQATSAPERAEEETGAASTAPAATAAAEATVEGKKFPFVKDFDSAELSGEGEVTLYFVNGGDIPYVALSEYMPLLSEILAGEGIEGVEFEVSGEDAAPHNFSAIRDDNKSFMFIDTEKDELVFTNFNSFTQEPGVNALVAIASLSDPMKIDDEAMIDELAAAKTDEERAKVQEKWHEASSVKENSLLRSASASVNRPGGIKTLNLADYGIDLVDRDGECYIPLQTMNDLFVGSVYVRCVFNGEKLFALKFGSELIDSINEASPAPMSDEFADFNRAELTLLLDNFYGLKPEHNIQDFDSLISADPSLAGGFSSTDPAAFEDALTRLTFTFFDDTHSGFTDPSWRVEKGGEDSGPSMDDLGASSTTIFKTSERLSSARREAYPDGVPMYEEVGDTAFVTFDAFTSASNLEDYYSSEHVIDPDSLVITGAEDEAPADTIDLIHYANEQILREGSPIKRVVVDLSNNGGGSSDAAIFVISWLLGKADIALRDTFTGAQTYMTIIADVNFNNAYDEPADSLRWHDIEVYCLTSPASFSCGNLVPAALAASKRATLVGKTSGGGSCAVLPCTSASGAFFQISGPKQLAIMKNGSFYNIDSGIEPDIVLTKMASYYDRATLVQHLESAI